MRILTAVLGGGLMAAGIDVVASIAIALLATDADPISAIGPGYIGTGLLGAVLSWVLFINIPNNRKEYRELMDVKDKQIQNQMDARDKQADCHSALQTQMLGTFSNAQQESLRSFNDRNQKILELITTELTEERSVCEKRHQENRDRMDITNSQIKEVGHTNANILSVLSGSQTIQEALQKIKERREKILGPYPEKKNEDK